MTCEIRISKLSAKGDDEYGGRYPNLQHLVSVHLSVF